MKKKMYFNSHKLANSKHLHEYAHYICAIVDDALKIWTPKDADEVKCVIENMRESCHLSFTAKYRHLKKYISPSATTTREDRNSRVQEHLPEEVYDV